MAPMPTPCPCCGAPLAEPGTCRYCRSGTLWEGEASESRPSALRCPRCADNAALAEGLAEGDAPRPSLGPELVELRHGPAVVRACLVCQGGWFDVGKLDAVLAHARELRSPPEGALGPLAGAEPVRYLRCPRCAWIMARVNYARASGIILDQCPTHGVWVDGGELLRLKAWVRARERPAPPAPAPRGAPAPAERGLLTLEHRRGGGWGWAELVDMVVSLLTQL